MRVGPWRRLSAEELMLLNCGAGEDSLESLGQQGNQTSLLQRKSTLNIYWSTEAEAEVPVLWLSDVKSRLTGKDPDAGKDWGQEEKGVTEDEMIRWHHRLNGHEFEQTPEDGEGQSSLCWVHRVTNSQTWLSDWTELNWTEISFSCSITLDQVSVGHMHGSVSGFSIQFHWPIYLSLHHCLAILVFVAFS